MPAVKSVDLCEKHLQALGYNRRERAHKPASKPKVKAAWNRADYDAINRQVMDLSDKLPMFNATDVCKAIKIKPHIAKESITMLVKAGKLEATGIGRGRKLSKVG